MSNTDQNPAQEESTRIAEHAYIDANGAVVEDIEQATGISYKHKKLNETFTYNFAEHGGKAGGVLTMFAIFGAKTRAGNATSAARGKQKRDATYTQSEIDYLREVFAETQDGQWSVAGESGTRQKIDLEILHAAVVEHASNSGATVDDEYKSKLTAKLDSDLAFRRGAYNNPKVREIYNRLAGKPESPVDLFNL